MALSATEKSMPRNISIKTDAMWNWDKMPFQSNINRLELVARTKAKSLSFFANESRHKTGGTGIALQKLHEARVWIFLGHLIDIHITTVSPLFSLPSEL